MVHLLLAIIYLSFISLGLPDSLLGAAWPSMYTQMSVPVSYAGILSLLISAGTMSPVCSATGLPENLAPVPSPPSVSP